MATTKETVLARISIDDNTKVGFQSYARNAERAKKTTEAFRAHAVDKLVESLDKQVLALGKSARELDLLKAATLNAADGELALINKLHDDIDAHNQATEAAIRLNKERDQEAAAAQKIADAVNRTNNAYRDEAATVDMTSDELEIYRLKMMGATQEQLDSVAATQQATKQFRKQGSAAKGANGQLRLMRGGLGQLGHQVQDVAVQLQMGQNAMLIFGQQGSQIASLFGQNGALIGAVLAVGAAIGTALAPSIFKTVDSFEELKKIAEATEKILTIDFLTGTSNLADEFEKLAKESKALADASIRMALLEAFKAATIAEEEFARVTKKLLPGLVAVSTTVGVAGDKIGNLSGSLGINIEQAERLDAAHIAMIRGVKGSKEAFVELVRELAAGQPITSEMNEALVGSDEALQRLSVESSRSEQRVATLTALLQGKKIATKGDADATNEAADALADANEKRQDFINSLSRELTAIGLTNVELAVRNARLLGMSEKEVNLVRIKAEQIRITNDYNAQLEIEKRQEEALIESKQNFVSGVVAQADALGKSNIELLLASDLVKGLDTEQKKAFDNAIKRLKDFQAAQEQEQKVESAKGKLESLRQSLLTEEQALEQSMVNQNLILVENLALGVINEQTFRDMQLQVIEDFNEKKKALLDQGVTDELEGMSFLQRASIEGTKRLETFNKLSATEQTQHVLGELSGQFNGIAKNNKKLFELSKKLNIASAIMNTADAATLAYKSYPPPLNYVMAGGVIAAGMGQVAQIKAQSFDGGGFTGTGGRSGGVDGKGGFPAILHPNETVIDHTKGQGGGITVVNNIDATGADANVDMKIRAAVQQSSQQTILSIQDLIRRKRFG